MQFQLQKETKVFLEGDRQWIVSEFDMVKSELLCDKDERVVNPSRISMSLCGNISLAKVDFKTEISPIATSFIFK